MRILLCTDGSPHGQAALSYGALIAQRSPVPATLLGVLEQPTDLVVLENALEEGQRLLEGAPSPQVKIRQGHAAEEILNEAIQEYYNMIVIGARGRRGITRFLLGSTSERVARHAPVPVLIVQGAQQALRRVLICTAGGNPGFKAVEVGGQVAGLTGAQVTVLHIISQVAATVSLPHELLDDLEASAEILMKRNTREGVHLRKALDILSGLDVDSRACVRHGLVVDEILVEVQEGDFDLVVIGAQVAEGLIRFLLEDVTHQVVANIDRPVLVAKM